MWRPRKNSIQIRCFVFRPAPLVVVLLHLSRRSLPLVRIVIPPSFQTLRSLARLIRVIVREAHDLCQPAAPTQRLHDDGRQELRLVTSHFFVPSRRQTEYHDDHADGCVEYAYGSLEDQSRFVDLCNGQIVAAALRGIHTVRERAEAAG